MKYAYDLSPLLSWSMAISAVASESPLQLQPHREFAIIVSKLEPAIDTWSTRRRKPKPEYAMGIADEDGKGHLHMLWSRTSADAVSPSFERALSRSLVLE
jgi:hypothetical protein